MTTSNRYCPFCGSQISETTRYCIQCGAPVESSSESPAAEPINSTIRIEDLPDITPEPPKLEPYPTPLYTPPRNVEPPMRLPQTTSRRPAWIIIVLVVLALCVCIGCFLSIGLGAFFMTAQEETASALVAVITQEFSKIPDPLLPETPLPIPMETVVVPETPAFPGREVFTQGIHFNLSEDVAQDISAETIPATTGNDLPDWEIGPEYTTIHFSGYQAAGDTYHQAQLFIYPADQYAVTNPSAMGVIDQLKAILTTKSASFSGGYLPFLPLWNAGQVFNSNTAYLDFQNGSGIRYLTQYGQDIYPINNYSLFYTFQGLTSDDRFYVAAIFPVSNPVLPDPDSIEMDQEFYDTFEQYIATTEFLLEAQPLENFSPNLTVLDQLIESIRIER